VPKRITSPHETTGASPTTAAIRARCGLRTAASEPAAPPIDHRNSTMRSAPCATAKSIAAAMSSDSAAPSVDARRAGPSPSPRNEGTSEVRPSASATATERSAVTRVEPWPCTWMPQVDASKSVDAGDVDEPGPAAVPPSGGGISHAGQGPAGASTTVSATRPGAWASAFGKM